MTRMLGCVVIMVSLLGLAGCRERVDLVREWGVESATKVVLIRKLTKRTVTLSDSAEIRRFLTHLRRGSYVGKMELLAIGDGEIETSGGRLCQFVILLHGSRDPNPRMAVQKYGAGTARPCYYLPKGFMKFWSERLGLPGGGI